MLIAQNENQNIKIEILLVQISTYFSAVKKTVDSYFTREQWLLTTEKIKTFIDLL